MEAFNKIIARTKNPTRRAILAVWKRQHFSCSATYIAKELDITPSYVSQVLKNTKHVLRKELEARNDIRREYN
jgi:predicted transcriptional regulator